MKNEKCKRKEPKEENNLLFAQMCGEFLKIRRAQRLDVHYGIMKNGNQNVRLKKHTEKKRRWVNLEPKNGLLEFSMSQRHNNYHCLVKNRVAARTLRLTRRTSAFAFSYRKWCPNDTFWNILKIGNGTQIQFVNKDRHRGP